jgi:hypothetical protein
MLKRVEPLKELLSRLESQKQRTWHELWLHIRTEHELVWLLPGEDVPEKEPRASQSGQTMLIIEWNPTGFHIVNLLSKSTSSRELIPLTYLKIMSHLSDLAAPNRTVRIDLPQSIQGEKKERAASSSSIDPFSC